MNSAPLGRSSCGARPCRSRRGRSSDGRSSLDRAHRWSVAMRTSGCWSSSRAAPSPSAGPTWSRVIAPAGTGKSRLVEEFVARLDAVAPISQVAVAQCMPYGQRLTYWPMRALLLSLLDLREDDPTPETIHQRARGWLEEAGAETPAETAELLAATIGASDTDVLDRTALFAAWRTTIELAAARRPLVLIVEDLHWSSDSLLDLVEFILQPRADSPMLMLAMTRPELLDRRPNWGGGRRNHVSLALEPLDVDSVERLVQNMLDGPAPELVEIVVQRSEGNPFYAGEIVRSMVERGVDLRDPAAVANAAAGLPDTVQATVLSRLDTLDPVPRRVLQLGSVFGRAFAVDGLAALEPRLADDADQAVDRPGRPGPAPAGRSRRARLPAHPDPGGRLRDAAPGRTFRASSRRRSLARSRVGRPRGRAGGADRLPLPRGRDPGRISWRATRGGGGGRRSMAPTRCRGRRRGARERRGRGPPSVGDRAGPRGRAARDVRAHGSGVRLGRPSGPGLRGGLPAGARAWPPGRLPGRQPGATADRHVPLVGVGRAPAVIR